MSQIGDILTELRKDKGLTQKELAKEFSVAASTISAYELGSHLPPVDIVVQYAQKFDVTTDYILGLSRVQDKPSSFSEEYVPGRTVGMLVRSMRKLLPEQKQALTHVIESMRFYAAVTAQTEANGDKLK